MTDLLKKIYSVVKAEWDRENREHPVVSRIMLIWVPIIMVLYVVMTILSRK